MQPMTSHRKLYGGAHIIAALAQNLPPGRRLLPYSHNFIFLIDH